MNYSEKKDLFSRAPFALPCPDNHLRVGAKHCGRLAEHGFELLLNCIVACACKLTDPILVIRALLVGRKRCGVAICFGKTLGLETWQRTRMRKNEEQLACRFEGRAVWAIDRASKANAIATAFHRSC